MKFFVWLNDQQQGPFPERTIQKMLAEKQITKDTLICPEGGDLDWIPAKDLFLQDSLPESLIPPPSIDELLEQSDDGSRLDIRLNSGEELKIKAIRLYDEVALARINSKRAEAMKTLKGVSTGIAPWGSNWMGARSFCRYWNSRIGFISRRNFNRGKTTSRSDSSRAESSSRRRFLSCC